MARLDVVRLALADTAGHTPAGGSVADGNGLGLAIVQAIADLHGASLELGPGKRLGGLAADLRFAAGAA